MKLRAHAKVNLHLRVRGRRADGFHEIETLMAPISLADEITLTTSRGDSVTVRCDNPEVPTGDSNLAAAAAREFSQRTGIRFRADIVIRKLIPVGAGLGGGSSDAAAVLVGLDDIFHTRLGFEKLEAAAANLGSDVPFFIRGVPAVCRGRGEIIEPAVLSQKVRLLLLKPPFGVETPWAYKAWAASRLRGSNAEQEIEGIKIFNSLEAPVFERFILLPEMKDWLKRQPGVRAAAMSGSGSTIFAVLSEGASGAELEARARERYGDTLWTALCDLPA